MCQWLSVYLVILISGCSRPIYGVQFHPEKNIFEWGEKEKIDAIPHWKEAIQAAQYLASFFVDEGTYILPGIRSHSWDMVVRVDG